MTVLKSNRLARQTKVSPRKMTAVGKRSKQEANRRRAEAEKLRLRAQQLDGWSFRATAAAVVLMVVFFCSWAAGPSWFTHLALTLSFGAMGTHLLLDRRVGALTARAEELDS